MLTDEGVDDKQFTFSYFTFIVVISLHREAKTKKKKQEGIVSHSSVEVEFKGICHLDFIKHYGSEFYYMIWVVHQGNQFNYITIRKQHAILPIM